MSGRAPLILAFDTSAAHCVAALLSGDAVLADAHEDMSKGQGERLFPLLEEVLRAGGAHWGDLTRIGVGIGPGNFTGIRLSVAAARGLALSLGVPAVGVSVLAAQAHGTGGPVVSSLDARRDALYLQGFAPDVPPCMVTLDDLPAIAASPVCIGYRANAIAAQYGGTVASAAYPLARAIALCAAADAATYRPAPLYLRPADAAPPRDAPPVILP